MFFEKEAYRRYVGITGTILSTTMLEQEIIWD